MISFLKNNLFWTEALPIFFVILGVGVVSLIFYKPFLFVVFGFFLFCLFFFRNPDRVCNEASTDSSVIISPADGKIIDIVYDEKNGIEGYAQRVSIFLSPFDVHVNWAPISGKIKEVKYKKGAFKVAYLPKSSELNERNDLLIEDEDGRTIRVRQIAGTIARRIVCWKREGELVEAGQKFGMIKFGSRVDILLPAAAKLNVGIGQKVYGGQTVLGRW